MQTPADRIAKRLSAEELRTHTGAAIVARGPRVSARKGDTPPADRIAVRA